MSYPKHLYKGFYTEAAIHAEEKIVADEPQEKAARKHGFIDGHEFFSKLSQPEPSKPVSDLKSTSDQFDPKDRVDTKFREGTQISQAPKKS